VLVVHRRTEGLPRRLREGGNRQQRRVLSFFSSAFQLSLLLPLDGSDADVNPVLLGPLHEILHAELTSVEHPHLLIELDPDRFEVGYLRELLLLKKTSTLLLLLLEGDGVSLKDVGGVRGVGEGGVDETAVKTFLCIVDGGDDGRVGVRLVRREGLGMRVRVSLVGALLASLESGRTTTRNVAFSSLTRQRRRRLDVLPPVYDATARGRPVAVLEAEVLESLVEVVLDSRKATATVEVGAVLHRRLPRFVHLPTKLDGDGRTVTVEDASGRGRRGSGLANTTRQSRNGDDDFLLVLNDFEAFRVPASLHDGLGNAADVFRSVHGERNEYEGNL
jgi:hypothetical protein